MAKIFITNREGEQSGQMTVQILPDELKKLLHACEQALS